MGDGMTVFFGKELLFTLKGRCSCLCFRLCLCLWVFGASRGLNVKDEGWRV